MSILQQYRVLLYAFCMCRNLCRWTPPLHRVSLERKDLLPCVKSLFSQAYTREQFNEICREQCDGYPTLKDVKKTVYWVSGITRLHVESHILLMVILKYMYVCTFSLIFSQQFTAKFSQLFCTLFFSPPPPPPPHTHTIHHRLLSKISSHSVTVTIDKEL